MLGMRLSARADYALRAAIELASATDGHVTADRIARAQQIPGKFLETILTQLRRAGLIRSQRGPEGGFWLARPAAEISLAEIIRAIDGPLLGVRGERPENIDYPGAARPLQEVWIALRANERAILEEVTLAHIVSGELPARVQALTDNPQAWVSGSLGVGRPRCRAAWVWVTGAWDTPAGAGDANGGRGLGVGHGGLGYAG